MTPRLIFVLGAWILAATALPAEASARGIRFTGPHPVSPKLLKGMCYIQGPHVHAYRPHKPILYVKVGPDYSFVGDPVEFEAKAPRYAYYGHHPVFWLGPPGHHRHYCYITGPHHHWHPPPPTFRAKFKLKGGVRWYVGGHPKWYRPKHWRVRAFGRHYGSVHFGRPVVHVKPPRGFVGVVFAPGLHGKVKIHGPGVKVKMKGKSLFGVPLVGGKVKIKGGMHGGLHFKMKGGMHGMAHFKMKGGHRGMAHFRGKRGGMAHFRGKRGGMAHFRGKRGGRGGKGRGMRR